MALHNAAEAEVAIWAALSCSQTFAHPNGFAGNGRGEEFGFASEIAKAVVAHVRAKSPNLAITPKPSKREANRAIKLAQQSQGVTA